MVRCTVHGVRYRVCVVRCTHIKRTQAVSPNYAAINHSYSQIRHTINHACAIAEMRHFYHNNPIFKCDRTARNEECTVFVRRFMFHLSVSSMCCDLIYWLITSILIRLIFLFARCCIQINHLFESYFKSDPINQQDCGYCLKTMQHIVLLLQTATEHVWCRNNQNIGKQFQNMFFCLFLSWVNWTQSWIELLFSNKFINI